MSQLVNGPCSAIDENYFWSFDQVYVEKVLPKRWSANAFLTSTNAALEGQIRREFELRVDSRLGGVEAVPVAAQLVAPLPPEQPHVQPIVCPQQCWNFPGLSKIGNCSEMIWFPLLLVAAQFMKIDKLEFSRILIIQFWNFRTRFGAKLCKSCRSWNESINAYTYLNGY